MELNGKEMSKVIHKSQSIVWLTSPYRSHIVSTAVSVPGVDNTGGVNSNSH